TKFRCIRSLLDLAAATGYAPHARKALARYTLTDAVYQAEQVCEIWQRLTSPHIESL
ncbi:3'-5' exoribonuclease, partial [Escherichia coli]|nr:3'-5' exoribonuclease [Escherichia coli]